MKEIEKKVIEWARDRGIYNESDAIGQFRKLQEEVAELGDAIGLSPGKIEDLSEVIDAIGDCLVVLTNIAHFANVNLQFCYSVAYGQIKNRKGKMVDGLFEKEKNDEY